MKENRVTIIILNYNGKKFILECLSSVFEQDYSNLEVLLIDNASTDESVDLIKKKFKSHIQSKRLKIVVNKENLFFAKGNNIGYALVKTPYVCLLNNDTIVPKNWLSSLMKSLIKNKAQIVGSYDFPFGKKDLFKIRINYTKTLNLVGSNANPESENKETIFVSGVSCLINTKITDKLFDDDYFGYGEDTYLCWKALLNDNKVIYEPSSRLWHYGSATSNQFQSSNLYYRERNRLINTLIFYESKTFFQILPILTLDTMIRTIKYSTKKELFREWIRSFSWIFNNFNKIMHKRKKIQLSRKINDAQILKLLTYKLFPKKENIPFLNLINNLVYIYCKLFKLKTMEFYK